MQTVTISLPPELVAELDRVREREHRTRSEILRDAVTSPSRSAAA
jgi:metal-responsive CopG/Arc/MetJ family transcriptional regulator